MSYNRFKQRTPITFKKAAMVVVVLHVAGFTILYGWSTYRGNRAKLERQLKMAAAVANYNTDKTFWNTQDKKLKVVAVSPITKLNPFVKPKPTIKEQLVDKVSTFIIDTKSRVDTIASVSSSFLNETKDAVNQIEKKIDQPQQLKSKNTKTPTKKPNPVLKPKKPQQVTAPVTMAQALNLPSPAPTSTPTRSYTKQTATKNGKTYTQYEEYEEIRRPVNTVQVYYPSLPREVPTRVSPPPSYPSAGYIPGESVRVYYQ